MVSQQVGISTRSLSRYIAGDAEMPASTALRLCQVVGKSLNWLLTGKGHDESVALTPNAAFDAVSIPLLSVEGSAGPGRQNHRSDIIAMLPFPGALLRSLGVGPESAHFITARGDSMEPTIRDGAIVLVDVSKRKLREDGIYAVVIGDDVKIKRLLFGVSSLTLISDNSEKYPREIIGAAEIDLVKIVGKVFWTGSGL